MERPPFEKYHELNHTQINPPVETADDEPNHVIEFLENEFLTADLDKMAPHLWLMSTQSGSNITPLHGQIVKGRQIVITEDPRLHLLWIYGRIFIKPLPVYLLAHSFWENYLLSRDSPLRKTKYSNEREYFLPAERIGKAALGYLRTWVFLIKHESDFRLAQEKHLIPIHSSVTYSALKGFLREIEHTTDGEVSPRYRFGELRLTRLNIWCKVFLLRSSYMDLYPQYGTYFTRIYGPILAIFGTISVILSAFQVVLASESSGSGWDAVTGASRWFSVICLLFCAIVVSVFFGILTVKVFNEVVYAAKGRFLQSKQTRRLT